MIEFDAFKKYLSGFLEVPPLEWLHLIKYLRLCQIKKNAIYFHQGDMVEDIGFIVKGLCCNFYSDADGRESVNTFIREGQPLAPYSNLLSGTPADFTCRAIESTTLITLKYKDLQSLYERHKCWERMGRISAERLFIEKGVREKEFLMMDAKARYNAFLKNNETLAGRVPQYLIASYLGISEVSLSRLRQKP